MCSLRVQDWFPNLMIEAEGTDEKWHRCTRKDGVTPKCP